MPSTVKNYCESATIETYDVTTGIENYRPNMTGNDSMAFTMTALIDDEELQMPAATENYSVSTKFEDYTVSVRLALSGTIICLSRSKMTIYPYND